MSGVHIRVDAIATTYHHPPLPKMGDLVELENHQVQNIAFPPKCPVYIYDDSQQPPVCTNQGIISRVMLCIPTVETFFEVDLESSKKKRLCKLKNIRFRNGCPVSVKYQRKRANGTSAKEEIVDGIVLGVCDNPYAGDDHAKYQFWYSVQLLENNSAGALASSLSRNILHEVSPDRVLYRAICNTEGAEEEDDEVEIIEDAPVKIENDVTHDERDSLIPKAGFPSQNRAVESLQSSVKIPLGQDCHASNDTVSKPLICKKENERDSLIPEVGFPTQDRAVESLQSSAKIPLGRDCHASNDDTVSTPLICKKENERDSLIPEVAFPTQDRAVESFQSSAKIPLGRECHASNDDTVSKPLNCKKENTAKPFAQSSSVDNFREELKNVPKSSNNSNEYARTSRMSLISDCSGDMNDASSQSVICKKDDGVKPPTKSPTVDKVREEFQRHPNDFSKFNKDARKDRTRRFSDCNSLVNQPLLHKRKSDDNAIDWRYLKPSPYESRSKEYLGNTYFWCGKCNGAKGMWVRHEEKDHPSSMSKRKDNENQHNSNANVLSTAVKKNPFAPQILGEKRRASHCLRVESKNKNDASSDHSVNHKSSGRFFDKFLPPGPSESTTTTIKGRPYYWCGKCKDGNGYWTGHKESEHRGTTRQGNKKLKANPAARSEVSENDNQRSSGEGRPAFSEYNRDYQKARFQELYDQKNSLNTLLARSDIPLSFWDKKKHMCVWYHVKGSCRSDCVNSIDHKETPPDHMDYFFSWCERSFFGNEESRGRPNHRSECSMRNNDTSMYTWKIDLPESVFREAKDCKSFRNLLNDDVH